MIKFSFFISVADEPYSISQISPKSDSIHLDNNEFLETSINLEGTQFESSKIQPQTTKEDNESKSESDDSHLRIVRSALPILNEIPSKQNFIENNNEVENSENNESGRYFNLIKPTSTSTVNPDSADMTQNSRMAKELSEDSFLLKGGPRSLTSGSPINPTSVMPMASTATMTNNPRQNPNPDIQDIITGIVKLLNGNVNVHANTQTSRRPVHTRINNRGPPRLSENPPSQLDYERPPPYPFERPEGPARPFLTGVPIPEQIVPSMQQNYRPGFISQNRPPWQRPRPRPPVNNRRPFPSYKPIPMPEYRPEDEIQLTTVEVPTDTKIDENNYEVAENGYDYLPNEMPQEPFTKKEEVTKKKDKNPGKSTEKKPSIEATPTISSIIESTTHIVPLITESEDIQISSLESSIEDSLTTISSSHSETIPIPSKTMETSTSEIQSTSLTIQSTSASSQNEVKTAESTSVPNFNEYHPRPGIVLDDPEFKPGGHARPTSQQPPIQQQQRPIPPVQPSRPNLPPGYGEIFDITLSAIQGPGSGSSSKQTVNIKPYGSYGTAPLPGTGQGNYGADIVTGAGTGNGDIIISPTGDESFVSIDGKRTYIDLFGEPTAPPSSSTTLQRPTVKPTQVVSFSFVIFL